MSYLGQQNYKMVNGRDLPYNYIYPGNPTVDINPPVQYMTWFNSLNGDIYTCLDNTVGKNIWVSGAGRIVKNIFDDSSCTHMFSMMGTYDDSDAIASVLGTDVDWDPSGLGLYATALNGSAVFGRLIYNTPFTVSFLAKCTERFKFNTDIGIIDTYSGLSLTIIDGAVGIQYNDNLLKTTSSRYNVSNYNLDIDITKYNHIILQIRGFNDHTLHINTEEIVLNYSSGGASSLVFNPNGITGIGGYSSASSGDSHSCCAMFRLFNRANLSTDEISKLYAEAMRIKEFKSA